MGPAVARLQGTFSEAEGQARCRVGRGSSPTSEIISLARKFGYSVGVAENPQVVQIRHHRRRRRKKRSTLKRRLFKIGLWLVFFVVWGFAVVKATRYFAERQELGKRQQWIDMSAPSDWKPEK